MFSSDEDREYFMNTLIYYAHEADLELVDYCLMDNHSHLLLVPNKEDSIAKTLKPVHMLYSQRMNRRSGEIGLNWQGRFYSSPMDEIHAWNAIKYVALNPVRAGLVGKPEEYIWSGARSHLGLTRDPYIFANVKWLDMARDANLELKSENASEFQKEYFEVIRKNTYMNLPSGGKSWLEGLEVRFRRSLTARGRGRPKKLGENR